MKKENSESNLMYALNIQNLKNNFTVSGGPKISHKGKVNFLFFVAQENISG